MLNDNEIHERMTYHPPSDDGRIRHATLIAQFEHLMGVVEDIVPDGREKALVFTKLEEAKMWASAGVARNPETR